VPKVIDFGIAKATEGRLTDATIYTQLHQFIGTPAYMSPEQAERSGLDIDTRSDIYSLGVLLYELLAGCTPFDAEELMASGLDAMRKMVREREPVRPSTRLATLKGEELTTTARRRSAEASKLIHLLEGDLDWIVMKCLEKDRTRRYETASDLAADLKRHLDDEPVTARPPSAAYRFQKAFRRNKLAFAAASAIAVVLVVATAISVWQAAKALEEKANAQAALHFIQDDVLSQASPGFQANRDLTVRALLDRVADRLDRAGKRPPLVEASIRQTLGSVYTELGDYTKAVQHYEGALQLQRQHLGESHPETLRSLCGLMMTYFWSGGVIQAEPLTRQGLEASRRVLGEKHPLTLQFMQARAFVMMNLGEAPWTEVEPLFLQALALHREVLAPDDLGTLRLIGGLGQGYGSNWQDAKAEPLLVAALEQSRRVLGEKHPDVFFVMAVLANVYSHLNQFEKAELLQLRVVELRRSILGEEHPLTINSVAILARIYVQQQQFDKAEPLTDLALNFSRRLHLEQSPFLASHLSNLGWEHLEQGHVAQADTLCEMAEQARRRKPGGYPLANSCIITHLGAVRLAQRRYPEAEPLLREGLRLSEKHCPDAAYRFYAMSLLGASLAGQKRYAEAEPLLLQSCQELQQRPASLSPYLKPTRRIRESIERLAQLYDAWGNPAQAAEWKQKLAEFEQTAKARDSGSIPGARNP
jgi:eukaryotic-like serine/threonine-protein kinase